MKTYTRREMLACLMAGGVVTAAGLWWPRKKVISIPKSHTHTVTVGGYDFTYKPNKVYTIKHNGDGTVNRGVLHLVDDKYVEVHPDSDLEPGSLIHMHRTDI